MAVEAVVALLVVAQKRAVLEPRPEVVERAVHMFGGGKVRVQGCQWREKGGEQNNLYCSLRPQPWLPLPPPSPRKCARTKCRWFSSIRKYERVSMRARPHLGMVRICANMRPPRDPHATPVLFSKNDDRNESWMMVDCISGMARIESTTASTRVCVCVGGHHHGNDDARFCCIRRGLIIPAKSVKQRRKALCTRSFNH